MSRRRFQLLSPIAFQLQHLGFFRWLPSRADTSTAFVALPRAQRELAQTLLTLNAPIRGPRTGCSKQIIRLES